MIKSQITFTIEDIYEGRYFTASSSAGKIYECQIDGDSEVDIFDCIEKFMSEYNNLFRDSAKRNNPMSNTESIPVAKIHWTSNSTQ